MAARRVAAISTRALLVSYRQVAPRVSYRAYHIVAPTAARAAVKWPQFSGAQVRYHSATGSQAKVYNFDGVKSLSDAPDASRVLIDVREPAEYEAGYIPNAINIPVASAPDALFMPAHEFEDKFGFTKPTADQELIFYCKAGVRSSSAAKLAQQVGYQNVGEYQGSWLDWQKNSGEIEK